MLSALPVSNRRQRWLYAGLLLGFVATPPVTALAAAPSATIDTCFAPESDCAAFAVRAIEHAEREILVGAYGLTTGAASTSSLSSIRRPHAAATAGSTRWRARAWRCGSITVRGSHTRRRWSSTAQ